MCKPLKHYIDYLQYLIFKEENLFEGISKFLCQKWQTGVSIIKYSTISNLFHGKIVR